MNKDFRRHAIGALSVLLFIAAGCSKTSEREVRPWLRVKTKRHRVIVPHVLAMGTDEDVVEKKVGREWKEVARANDGLPIIELGDVVMVNSGAGLELHRGDTAAPVVIPHAECRNWVITADKKRILCTGCGDHPPLFSLRETVSTGAACPVVTATERSLDGQVLWTRHGTWPELPSACGRYPDHSVEECKLTARGGLLFYTTCSDGAGHEQKRYFALTESGIQALSKDEPTIPAFQLPGCG